MDTIIENNNIMTVVEAIIYLANAFVLFFIGKFVYQLFHKSINVKDELIEKDNFAFAVAHVGYFIGLLLSIGSAIIGPSNGLLIDLFDITMYGLLAIILLNISIIINDKIILSKFSVKKEIIDDRNSGTGVIEAAVAISSGLIIFGAISGESTTLIEGVITASVFWAIGQVMMIVTSFIYNAILSYDIHEHIEKDNVAVGVGFAGALIAIANLIRNSIMGDFISWQDNLIDVGIYVVIGLVLLPVIRFLTDKILLPGQKLTDEIVNQKKPNVGASLIEAFAYIGGSVLITWCI